MYNYSLMDKQILQICSCEYEYFLNKANVRGVALGYKIKNGFYTCKRCIKVYVSRKLSLFNLNKRDTIPLYYKGIPTDVEESGEITSFSLVKRIRPVECGYIIGTPINLDGGTMGCLVTDKKYYYILSNNHIIAACNRARLGTPVIQPSMEFGGSTPNDVIGKLSKYIPLRFIMLGQMPENYVDCAMALISKRSYVSTKITFLGRIKGTTSAKLGQNVQQVGAISELTKGKITAVGATAIVNNQVGKCLFKNQIITYKMGGPGDSGAILLDENMNAVGLLMGGALSKVIYNPIDTVLSALNVSIVTGR